MLCSCRVMRRTWALLREHKCRIGSSRARTSPLRLPTLPQQPPLGASRCWPSTNATPCQSAATPRRTALLHVNHARELLHAAQQQVALLERLRVQRVDGVRPARHATNDAAHVTFHTPPTQPGPVTSAYPCPPRSPCRPCLPAHRLVSITPATLSILACSRSAQMKSTSSASRKDGATSKAAAMESSVTDL
jgi:hypothetical protein